MKKSDLEYVNSVARIKNRVAVSKYYFDKLPKDIQSLAFTVSNLETLRQIQMVQRSLENAIEKGESFSSWKANLDTDVLRSLSNARLETVYRTNTSTVYNQSTRFNASTSGVTPYLMYDAVGDERTRPEHLKLDGTVKRADSNFWDTYLPPIGFGCRCGVINMSKEDAEAQGISSRSTSSFPEPEDTFGQKKMGDVTTQVSKETKKAIDEMPNSALKTRFKTAQENIASLVEVWWEKNKQDFEVE